MPENISNHLKQFRADMEKFLSELGDLTSTQIREKSLDRGYYRLAQPEKYGGLNASHLQLAIARETVASAGIEKTNDVIGPEPGMLAETTKHIESNYLFPMLSGVKTGSFAFTESDPSTPTVAQLKGDSLVLNGRKSYVSGAIEADFISVVLNVVNDSVGPSGPAVVIVDTDYEGVYINEPFYSTDGSSHSEVSFDDVKVDTSNIIGDIGKGMPRAMGNIVRERIAQAATATGMALCAVTRVSEHLRLPHRSGGTLGDMEGVRLRYADMRIQTFACRSTLYRAARLMETGEQSINEASSAKLFCTESASSVIDTAIQLVGGRALIVGHPLESLYRRIRSMRLAGGASDILRLGISRGDLEFNSGIL